MAHDWLSHNYRLIIVGKINQMLKSTGTNLSMNASAMENHVYMNAHSKEEYLGIVAKLILHLKETSESVANTSDVQDFLNALQELAIQ